MTTTTHTRPRRRAGRIVAGSLGGLLLLTVLVAGTWYVGIWGAPPRTVVSMLTSAGVPDPVDVTSPRCEESGCVEAWDTSHGTYLGFSTSGDAEYWETVLGDDGRRWRNVVLDLRGADLTFEELRAAVDVLYVHHDWS
ncbi:hypothetical protein [Oerskovia turbata]